MNSFTDVNNNETGGLSYSEYIVPLPGASIVIDFANEANYEQQELMNGATSYSIANSVVTINSPLSDSVNVGCRIQLNGQWFTIDNLINETHLSVVGNPAAFGTVNHVYCTALDNNSLKLNGNAVVGPGDLSTFNKVVVDPIAQADHDTWAKPVVYASGINKYVTAGYENVYDNGWRYHAVVYESSDLQTWTKHVLDSTTSNTQAKSMIYEPVSGKIVIAGYDDTSGTDSFVVWESTDAVNWSKQVVNSVGSWWDGPQMIVYDPDGRRYVFGALYYNGSQYTLTAWESSDLVTWTAHTVQNFSNYPNITSLLYSNGRYVFSGSYSGAGYRRASVWESSDLTIWIQHDVETNTSGNTRMTSIAYNARDGKYVGIGWDMSTYSVIWESTDLVNWSKGNFYPASSSWNAAIMYNELSGKYIVGGEARDQTTGYWYGAIWYSSDLVNWTTVYVTPQGVDGRVMGLYYDEVNGRFLGAGMVWGSNQDEATVWYTNPGTIYNYPPNIPYVIATSVQSQLDTSNWLSINTVSAVQDLNGGAIYAAFSFNNQTIWKVLAPNQPQWREIVRFESGVWQYNAAVTYDNQAWSASTINTQEYALSLAMNIPVNQMRTDDIAAFSTTDFGKAGGFTSRNPTLDLAVGVYTNVVTESPTLTSFLINYENSFSDSAVTIASKAAGNGDVKPFQVQVGTNTSAIFVDQNGNVGIGTNTPHGKFDVMGKLVLLDNGNLGVGNSNPQFALDVLGSANVVGDGIFGGNVTINGDVDVTGALTGFSIGSFAGQITSSSLLTGNATVSGILNQSASLTVGGRVGAMAGIDSRGSLVVAKADGAFLMPTSIPTASGYQYGVTVADFNHDSNPDVVSTAYSGVITVAMGNGNGTMQPGVNYQSGGAVTMDADVGDFNSDGHVDIVTVGWNIATVFINNGSGTFSPQSIYNSGNSGSWFSSVKASDVDLDGDIDIVLCDINTATVTVLRNEGSLNFVSSSYVTAGAPSSIVIGKVDSDNYPDVVTSHEGQGQITVLMNNQAGAYPTQVYYSTSSPQAVTLADINSDQFLDAVVTSYGSSTVTTFYNNGSGQFPTSNTVGGVPAYQFAITAADFNGDGDIDIATSAQSGYASLLINNGSGVLNAPVNYNVGSASNSITSGDINRDGAPDIVAGGGGYVSIFLNNLSVVLAADPVLGRVGIGTTTPGYKLDVQGGQINASEGICIAGNCWTSLPTMPAPTFNLLSMKNGVANVPVGLSVGDGAAVFTPQGNLKNIGNYRGGEMMLSRGGTFVVKGSYTSRDPSTITTGDLNNDGREDVVTSSVSSQVNSVTVLLANSDGSLAAGTEYYDYFVHDAALGDLNGDGYLDIVGVNLVGVSVRMNNGNGTFSSLTNYSIAMQHYSKSLIKDVNGDGKNDIIVLGKTSGFQGLIAVLLNNGNGQFPTSSVYSISALSTNSFEVGDVNYDGMPDVVVLNTTSISVLKNNGNGTFSSVTSLLTGLPSGNAMISLADVSGDGRFDVSVVNSTASVFSVYKNNGNGTFASRVDYAAPTTPVSIYSKDFNGDGYADMILSYQNGTSVSVFTNRGDGTFTSAVSYPTGLWSNASVAGDINGDGASDIVTMDYAADGITVLLNQKSPMFYAQASTGYVGIGTVTPGANLDVVGLTRVSGNIISNNTSMATGTLATAPATGTCTGQTNTTTQAVFQSTATLASSHVFYNATRTRHSRITSVASCTDGSSLQYRIVTLTDAITGSSAGDSYTVYNPASDIGNSTSGFFNTIYAINYKGLTSTLSGGFDLAEQYKTNDDTITEGEVVSIAVPSNGSLAREALVEKSSTESDTRVIGVVSTNPGLTFGNETEGTWVRVALAGRVPVRVATLNGPIAAGDFLTSSSMPGVAVKAVKPGMVIGRALHDFGCPEGQDSCVGTVDMFINLTWYSPWVIAPSEQPQIQAPSPMVTSNNTMQSGTALIKANNTMVSVVYAAPYTQPPLLMVSMQKKAVSYEIINESEAGFSIKLDTATAEDISFVWISFSGQSAQHSVSTE